MRRVFKRRRVGRFGGGWQWESPAEAQSTYAAQQAHLDMARATAERIKDPKRRAARMESVDHDQALLDQRYPFVAEGR